MTCFIEQNTEHDWKKRGMDKKEKIEGMNMIEMYYMHVREYHKETPL
jgi:hypothetical protein